MLREEREDLILEPEWRTHRGRASLVEEQGSMNGGKLVVLNIMPTKMDQGNRRRMRKLFRVGKKEEDLAPGRAIIEMMCGDRKG